MVKIYNLEIKFKPNFFAALTVFSVFNFDHPGGLARFSLQQTNYALYILLINRKSLHRILSSVDRI